MPLVTIKIAIKGLVQGVGFRPFVFRLAQELKIKGYVTNTDFGVLIIATGTEEVLDLFVEKLQKASPPLAKIHSIETTSLSFSDFDSFEILKSKKDRPISTQVSPDIAICKECRQEILDKKECRYNYPFTNCTNCGPRYTIIERLPYDRQFTSMKSFPMCNRCKQEFSNPFDRRFHAQPIACHDCGPRIFFPNDSRKSTSQILKTASRALKQGKILAIKGLGGFHLACNAWDTEAINTLRIRKKRPFKPLALMVKDLSTAEKICLLDEKARQTLTSESAPIVILPKNPSCALPETIAPGIDEVGIMLPYTPLHLLLFQQRDCPDCLIMTSGNKKDEPIITSNHQAESRLKDICDTFILHNRQIVTGIDDSVVRKSSIGNLMIRRARGFAPEPIELSFRAKKVLAVGAEMKNTFCLTKDHRAYVSQHIGLMTNPEVFDFYKKNIQHLSSLFEIEPSIVALDLHPDYVTSQFAKGLGLECIEVQHHLAHAASVMAEHNLEGPAIAIVLDGTGLGTDGTIWGGEILLIGHGRFKRAARLKPFRLPGGDLCAKNPWRSALSLALAAGISLEKIKKRLPQDKAKQVDFIAESIKRNINAPWSSSCGRLFDGVSALIGLCYQNTYDAQAAMELEANCQRFLKNDEISKSEYFKLIENEETIHKNQQGLIELDWTKIIRAIFQNQLKIGEYSTLLHAFLISSFSKAALYLSNHLEINTIILSGGCFQNKILIEGFINYLESKGLRPYINKKVPANDGGISLGQAFIANKLMEIN